MNLLQNLKNNSRKGDILIFISFLFIVAAMILFAYYIFDTKLNECTSDPIKFGVETVREIYEADKIHGTLSVYKESRMIAQWSFGDELDLFQLSTQTQS